MTYPTAATPSNNIGWTAETEFMSMEKKQKTGKQIIRDANGCFICKVENAHAYTIAAAPEALEALREVADFWLGGDCPEPLWTKIKTIIAFTDRT